MKLSVHDVVDTMLRQGSIDTRVFSSSTMQEGSRLHSVFQNEQGDDYESEVSVHTSFTFDEFTFVIDGRVDGIIKNKDSITIDEIKTTVEDLDKFYADNKEWHLGQAKFYAYIYACENQINRINIRLTYISQNDYKIKKHITFSYTYEEIKEYIFKLMNDYYETLSFFLRQSELRTKKFKDLTFPFPTYRKGQIEMIEAIHEACDNQGFAYIEAPTGTGKTASALFPCIKRLDDSNQKIFYLTSKNSIKMIALDTIKQFNQNGATIKAITISSKDNMCINDKKRHCNPDECPYAKDYYNKINRVVRSTYEKYDTLNYEDILLLGEKNKLCPFELQLDLSLFYDVIIADYNHLFSPNAHLSRFFDQGKKPYYLLIDECHNLPGRVRDIYSGTINYYDFYSVNKELKRIGKKTLKLRKTIQAVIDYFREIDLSESNIIQDCVPIEKIEEYFKNLLNRFVEQSRTFFKDEPDLSFDELVDLFYSTRNFLDLPSNDECFAHYYSLYNNKVIKINTICLDSREYIKNIKKIFLGGAMFSATLSPINFYLDLLKVEGYTNELVLPSPFPKENLNVMINPIISTLYKDRMNTLVYLKEAIVNFIGDRIGNHFVFFPSYAYMTSFLNLFANIDKYDIFVQESHMNEGQRNEFLSHFKKNPTRITIGFVVMGGSFSEGIDLVEDRLSGAIIIGVGLPMVCFENDCLKQYYNEEGNGYDYAYTYPGINKVLQASGRVIRSENDKGMILLIDTRYQNPFYKAILSEKYPQAKIVCTGLDIKKLTEEFYR